VAGLSSRGLSKSFWTRGLVVRRLGLSILAAVLTFGVTAGIAPSIYGRRADFGTAAGGILLLIVCFFGHFNWLLWMVGFLSWMGRPRSRDDGRIVTRVALVMPICQEDVHRVTSGIKAIWRSCKNSGLKEHCDFVVLGDTADAHVREAEESALAGLLDDFEGNTGSSGRLFLVRRDG